MKTMIAPTSHSCKKIKGDNAFKAFGTECGMCKILINHGYDCCSIFERAFELNKTSKMI